MALEQRWYPFWWWHRGYRWSIGLNHFGWHIVTPLFGLTYDFTKWGGTRWSFGFWPVRVPPEGGSLYKFGTKL